MNEEKQGTILCDVLKSLRIAKGLSIKQLSKESGISASYIAEIEKGQKTQPSLDTLSKYSEALDVKRSTIMFFQEEFEDKRYSFQEMLLNILEKMVKTSKISTQKD